MKEEQAKKRKREPAEKRSKPVSKSWKQETVRSTKTHGPSGCLHQCSGMYKLSREKAAIAEELEELYEKVGRAGLTVSSFLSPYVFMEAACRDAVQSIHHRYGLFLPPPHPGSMPR